LFLGVSTFIAALVPVFAIQFLLTRLVPSEHPVQELLTNDPSPRMLLLCVLSAVVVAPLAEEFLFRVLLQGWMEEVSLEWREGKQEGSPPIAAAPSAAETFVPFELPSTAEPASATSAEGPNPYSSPLAAPQHIEKPRTIAIRLMPLPIFFSSLLFALLHWRHGPDPVPLFVLALMLGYLYQKTHRIWPSLVVHACLNAWSLSVLWLSLRMGWN
jgi:membrane protease YdiL (CAAX protease family)